MYKVDNKKCLQCGKEFHPARKERLFCSRECSINYRKEHDKYIVSESTKQKMSNSHMGKTRIPEQLK